MNLILHIGPDTLGTTRYKSKDSISRALTRAAKKMVRGNSGSKNLGHLGYRFLGRFYCLSELQEAVILTPKEYFKALCRKD